MANLILSLKISVALLGILFINGFNGSDAREDSMYEVESLENLEKTAKSVSLKLANTRYQNRRIRRNEHDENDNDDTNDPTEDKFWDEDNVPDFLSSENEDNLDTTKAPIPLTTMKEEEKEEKKKGTCTASHKKKKTTSGKSCDCSNSNTTTTRICTRSRHTSPIPDHPVTIGHVKTSINRRSKRCPHGIYYRKGCRICYCLPKRKFCESVYTSEDCAYWAAKIHCEASRLMYQYNVKCEGPCECKSCKDPLKTVTTCARLPCHNGVLEQYGVLKTNVTELNREGTVK